ncbi:MAG TPA: hypothetical protein PL009_13780 [Flavipsychrobacter sp.]|nr:hypothetical protein [Flavipsychrobacter sp.]
MKDKDLLKQNSGAQQGNVHLDSDAGTNEGKQGSTADKTTNSEKANSNKADSKPSDKDLTTSEENREADTLGNP